MMKFNLLSLSILALLGSFAAQAASLTLVGAGDWNSTSWSGLPGGTSTPASNAKFGLGGGALLDFSLARRLGFEIGGLYITRKNEANPEIVSGNDVTLTAHAIQIPVLLKFFLLPGLHIGAGGYWADGIGSIDANNATTGTDNSGSSYAAQDLKKTDYGLVGEAGITLPITMRMRFVADARYNYGLTNVYTGSGTEKYRDLQALVGLQFALGGMR